MEITILFTTAKNAKLVTNNEKVVWLSPKEIDKDNVISAEGMDKLNNSELTYDQYLIDEKKSKEEFLQNLKAQNEAPFNVMELKEAETEKAIGIIAFTNTSDTTKTKLMWVPKSTIDGEGCVPQWMIDRNLQKLSEEIGSTTEWSKTL